MKEQSWLIPFHFFHQETGVSQSSYFFLLLQRICCFFPYTTSHYFTLSFPSHIWPPVVAAYFFFKISCHSVFTGSLYHFLLRFTLSSNYLNASVFSLNQMAVLFRICVIHAYWVTSNSATGTFSYIPDCKDCTLKAVFRGLCSCPPLGLGAYGLWTLHLFNFCTRSRIMIMYQ